MPRTKVKSEAVPVAAAPPPLNGAAVCEVLTLAEAAVYLRLSEDEVERLVWSERLPGRQIGKEWRFLKTALQDWLQMPSRKGTKAALLAMAGKYKDDPFLDEIVREAYRQRRLSVAEDSE